MSEQDVKAEKFILPMGKGRKEKVFQSFAAYLKMVEEEVAKWEWVRKDNGNFRYLSAEIYSLVMEPLFHPFRQGASAELTLSLLTSHCKNYIPIYSFSSDGKFILDVRDRHGEQIAQMVLFYVACAGYSGARLNHHSTNELSSMPAINQCAISLVFEYGMGSKLRAKSYFEAMESECHAFSTYIDAMTDKFDGVLECAESNCNLQAKNFDEQCKQQDSRFKKHISKYILWAKGTRRLVQEHYSDAKSDIENIRQAYHEKIDLEYSVNYWNERRRSHARHRGGWAAGIIFSLLATFGGMLFYYVCGGVSGIVTWFGGSISQAVITTSSADGESAKNVQLISETFFADVAGAALLLTLLAVLVRLSLRQFNISTQLHIEAAERVTMVKTYLALLNEGKLSADQDRRLALESLFRSSQLTPAADSGFNTPVDMMIKTLAERVGK